jgi:hypothetical protein
MAEKYTPATLEVKDKEKKIEDYFSVKKNQEPNVESEKKPELVEGDGNILRIEKELELAREEYVGSNFETENALAKISKFLHIKGDLGDKEALDLKKSKYQNKLNELLSLKIDELKRQNPENNKIGEKVKDLWESFNLNEETSLRVVRAKFEPQQEKTPQNNEQAKLENTQAKPEKLPNPVKINFDSIFQGDAGGATELFRSAIVLGGKWEDIENMTFGEAAKELEWRSNKKIENIFKRLKKRLGNDARPGDGEMLKKWTERVAKLAIEKSK